MKNGHWRSCDLNFGRKNKKERIAKKLVVMDCFFCLFFFFFFLVLISSHVKVQMVGFGRTESSPHGDYSPRFPQRDA